METAARIVDAVLRSTAPPLSPVHGIVCAWCRTVLREGSLPVSHGICEACSRTFEEKDQNTCACRPGITCQHHHRAPRPCPTCRRGTLKYFRGDAGGQLIEFALAE